ncbi:MAG: patatin-like phospholipase family protein [Microthrixaceae bacterium]
MTGADISDESAADVSQSGATSSGATSSDGTPAEATPADVADGRRSVALVLGSGGARGYAHIGVVQVLTELGYEIVSVSGSSMGAVVGGMLATGRLDDFTEWAVGLGQFEVLRLMDISLTSVGAIRGERVFRVVGELVGDVAIEDLPLDFTAVAVDLLTHREVWFQKGPLELAIRASAAIPSFVSPVVHNGRVLVDGGLLDPVPVAPVTASRADLVVAVNLNGREPTTERPQSGSSPASGWGSWRGGESEDIELTERLRGTAAKWFDSDLLATVRRRLPADVQDSVRARLDAERPTRPEPSKADTLGSVEIMAMSLEAMQGALTRHRLATYPPDVLISVPKGAARTLDMHRAAEMIELGRGLTLEALGRS